MYESPINIVEKSEEINSSLGEMLDNYVMSVVRSYGVDVNKEELVKALKYDREQYDKGFKDGFEYGVEAEGLKYERGQYSKGYMDGYEHGIEIGKRENTNPCSECQEFECDYCEHAVERRIEEALL